MARVVAISRQRARNKERGENATKTEANCTAILFAECRDQAKIHASDVHSRGISTSGGRVRDFQADCCRERDRPSRHERVVDHTCAFHWDLSNYVIVTIIDVQDNNVHTRVHGEKKKGTNFE